MNSIRADLEGVELYHGSSAQFDLVKLRSEFFRLCWRLVMIRSRLLQRWNDKLDNTCQVSFEWLGERYCDPYKGKLNLQNEDRKDRFFHSPFLSRRLLSLIRMVSTSEAIVWRTVLYGYWTGFRIETAKILTSRRVKSQNSYGRKFHTVQTGHTANK